MICLFCKLNELILADNAKNVNSKDLFMEHIEKLECLKKNLNSVLKGKEEVIELILIALLGGGNILLEDVPGVGKTSLAKALALSIDGDFNRIQFTPDLLPTDISGSLIFNPKTGDFNFRKGAIFTNILLADEINRASPRTQSALLEAMSEQQITVSGERHLLTAPFMVIATQNPVEYQGTYPLPEAQMDRFAMQLKIDYPDIKSELEMLISQKTANPLNELKAVIDCEDIRNMQEEVKEIEVETSVAKYMLEMITETRNDINLELGASPRASLTLYRHAQARAYLQKRSMVLPDDVKELAIPCLAHRLMLQTKSRHTGMTKAEVISNIINNIKVPV